MQRYARVPVLLLLTHRSLCLFLVKQQQKKQREQKQTQEEEEERRQHQAFFLIKILINRFLAIFLTAATEKKSRAIVFREKHAIFSPYFEGKKFEFAIFRQRVSAVRQNYGSHTGDHPQGEFAKFGLGSPKRKLGNFRNLPI
jgi:hypothetical protein